MEDLLAPATPTQGTQMLYSQVGEPAYKRLTRVIPVPAGGSTLTFDVNRDTEPGWDFLFVEARTAGGTDWTTHARCEWPLQPGRRRLPGVRRGEPVPRPLPQAGRGRSGRSLHTRGRPDLVRPDRDERRLERCERLERWLGDLVGRAAEHDECDPPGRGLDHLCERPVRPGSWRHARQCRFVDRSRFHQLRGRRERPGRLDGSARRTGRQRRQPEHVGHSSESSRAMPGLGVCALQSFDRQPEIIACREGLVRAISVLGVGWHRRRRAGRLRAREPDAADLLAGLLLRPDRTTSSSSTSSPTSGTATASPSTRGSTSGSTRASRRMPNGCGTSVKASAPPRRSSTPSRPSRPTMRFWDMAIGDPGP